MSTRIEGAAPALVRVSAKAELGAGGAAMRLTVTEEPDGLWKYNLSGPQASRVAYGRVTAQDHLTALQRAADILAEGFAPGTVERGLLETFAKDALR
jgi:hypothetical protein